jgi:hypothetical protein
MKTCPHCGGEIRPSVVKCVHCGRMLKEPAEPTGVGAPAAPPTIAGAVTSPTTSGTIVRPPPSRASGAAQEPWVTPATRADSEASPWTPPPPAIVHAPGQPQIARGRTRGVDVAPMVSGALLLVSAAVTYISLSMPWVQVRLLTDPEGALAPKEIADLSLTAQDSLAARIGLGLAIAFAVWGVLWFWYSLDRGAALPSFAHPGWAALGAVAGLAVAVFARIGYLFWDNGLIQHAREAGLTREEMQDILAQRPAPTIEVEILEALARFSVVMALALAAALVAWWAVRRRG